MLICTEADRPVTVGFRMDDKRSVRFARSEENIFSLLEENKYVCAGIDLSIPKVKTALIHAFSVNHFRCYFTVMI